MIQTKVNRLSLPHTNVVAGTVTTKRFVLDTLKHKVNQVEQTQTAGVPSENSIFTAVAAAWQ